MTRSLLIIMLLLIASLVGRAQILFQRVYGGNGYDSGCEVLEASDGGYYIAGSTGSFDENLSGQILLIKTDSFGYVEWRNTYGDQFADQATSMQFSVDGNILVGGYSETVDSSYQMLIMKLTLEGDVLWSKQFGGSEWEFNRQLVALPDGGCAAFGQTYSYGSGDGDFYLVRVDADGNLLWTKTYGGVGLESGESISVSSDGGFYLSGYTESFGSGKKDIYVVKTDAAGSAIWSNAFGWSEDEFAYGSCTVASDGAVVVVGGTFSNSPGEGDFMMYKISSVGDSVKAVLQDGSTDEYWTDVFEDGAGNFVMVGYVEDSQFGKEDVRVQRVDQYFDFDGMAASKGSMENDRGYDIKETSDGAYIVAGVTGGFLNRFDDVYLFKIGFNGEVVDPELGVNEVLLGNEVFKVTVGPNPVSGEFTNLRISDYQSLQSQVNGQLRVELFSVLGKRVYSAPVISAEQRLNVGTFESGIYFYRLIGENRILATGKLIRSN